MEHKDLSVEVAKLAKSKIMARKMNGVMPSSPFGYQFFKVYGLTVLTRVRYIYEGQIVPFIHDLMMLILSFILNPTIGHAPRFLV